MEETLRSVLLQRYPNVEYIVLDGGSTDESVEVIRHYAPHLTFWSSEKDAGQSDAIRRGFERASGDLMCWVNSDDALMPNALLRVAEAFAHDPGAGVVYGNRVTMDECGEIIGRQFPPFQLSLSSFSLGQWIGQECCFWRASVYREVGGVDRSKFFAMDYDLFVRMWMHSRFRKVRAFLGACRIHGAAKTAQFEDVMWREFEASKQALGVPSIPPWKKNVVVRVNRAQSRIERALSFVATMRDAIRPATEADGA